MKTLTATTARGDLFNLVKRSVRGHDQFRITSKEGAAILLSEDDYENLLETLELLSTPGFLRGFRKAKREIARGQTYSLDEVFGGK